MAMGLPHQACLSGGAGPRASRRGPLQPDPNCPDTSEADIVLHSTKGLGSCLLLLVLPVAKETEQKSVGDNHQANPLRPSWLCPPATECEGETSLGMRGPQGLHSLLLRRNEDRRALWEGQQQPCCSRCACLQEGQRAFLPAFSKLSSQVANSTITARWDQ